MKISFRQIKKNDYDFLWRLNKDLFEDYIEQIRGWDEDRQREDFDKNFDLDNGEIIVLEEKDIGFFWYIESPQFIFLRSILILPAYQNKGIGSKIIGDLIANSNKPMTLRVSKSNPARKLYERLGFIVAEETETNYIMDFSRDNNFDENK